MQSSAGGGNRPHRQPPPRPRPPPPPLPARPAPQRSATLASHAQPPPPTQQQPSTTTASPVTPPPSSTSATSSPRLARATTAWSSTLSPSSSPVSQPRGRATLRAQASLSSAPLMATTLTGGKFRIPAEGSTTIAVGKDTYTIVASRKSPAASGSAAAASAGKANSDNKENGGETIRIFRRSRTSGRPHSASRSDTLMVFDNDGQDSGGSGGSGGSGPFSLGGRVSYSNNGSGDTLLQHQHHSMDNALPGGLGSLVMTDAATPPAAAGPGPSGTGSPAPSLTSSDSVLKTEELPPPDTHQGTKEAFLKLKQMLTKLKESEVDRETLVSNLEYVVEVVQCVVAKIEDEAEDDELSELQSEAVPDEVRKWLASTFAKQEDCKAGAEAPVRRSEERPSFKSVANAIRTGIFIERIYRQMSSSQLMIIPPEVQRALKLTNEWTFDTFTFAQQCSGSPLRFLGYELLTRHGCLHKYKIPPSVLETMLLHVEAGYASNGNPYHNHMHACDVLQTINYFISQTGFDKWLSDLEIFTCLLAAIVHDFDHPGTTNAFHVSSASDLALLYNDRAVLENHHVSQFFRTIQQHNCNIFSNMQKSDFRELRNLMIEMVLHTDMNEHFAQIKSMKQAVQQNNGEPSYAFKQWRKLKHGRLIATSGSRLGASRREANFDKTKVLCLLLHSCDVSHPAKRWEIHHQWTSRCIEEFFKQGDREAEMGLDYSPLCDRHNTMVPQSQIGFIDFIVSPTLTVLGDVLDVILRGLDPAKNKGKDSKDDQSSTSSLSPFSTSSSTSSQGLRRPWIEVLAINRGHWQTKHDSGERGIAPSGADGDLRPSSVTSITGGGGSLHKSGSISRPSSASTSTAEATTATGAEATKANHVISAAKGHLERQDEVSGDGVLRGQNSVGSVGSNSGSSEVTLTSGTGGGGGSYRIESDPPDKATQFQDVVGELPPNVLSRQGTPDNWDFEEREKGALKTAPPRAASASLCSPPAPRKVPISVDHKLRK